MTPVFSAHGNLVYAGKTPESEMSVSYAHRTLSVLSRQLNISVSIFALCRSRCKTWSAYRQYCWQLPATWLSVSLFCCNDCARPLASLWSKIRCACAINVSTKIRTRAGHSVARGVHHQPEHNFASEVTVTQQNDFSYASYFLDAIWRNICCGITRKKAIQDDDSWNLSLDDEWSKITVFHSKISALNC